MPWNTPTLQQIAQLVFGAFRSNMKGSDAALWPNNVAVTAKVIAGAVQGPYAFQDYIAKQILPSTCDGPNLLKHAATRGMAQLAPSYATGNALISGDANVPVPVGIQLQRADGVQYETLVDASTDGSGNATVPVRALLPGKAGNAVAGVVLSLAAPVDRINTANEVDTGGIGAGADLEDIESLRARYLFVLQNPPQGGAAHDYVIWARQLNGITRVFVDPVTSINGRTTVAVWFMMDDTYPDGIPQAADANALDLYLNRLRPAGAVVDVGAPVPVAQNIVINGLTPNTLAVRNAVNAELIEMFRRETAVSTLTEPFTLYRSAISEAIAVAAGERSHTLVTPATDHLFDPGQIPTLGTVSFT